jgi:sialate O-acetylesterase
LNEYSSWFGRYQKKGYWNVCSPSTVPNFSAIAYVFARRLHMVSQVPIGMVDMSVGGTTVENWTSTASLKKVEGTKVIFDELAENQAQRLKSFNPEKDLEKRIKNWTRESQLRTRLKMTELPKPTQLRSEPDIERKAPGSWYNAMTASYKGFAVKGIIFNQGHNNALGDCRPKLYAKMFKAMIADWRANFDDPKLPFGIVAMVSGGKPQTLDNFEMQMLDAAPWIREAQYKAYLELPNMGYTASYDQQTGFYHPFSKVLLGERIARWALNTQYDQKQIGHAAIKVTDIKIEGNKYILTFDGLVSSMYESKRPLEGFAIAGADKHFYPAQVKFYVKGKDKHNRDQIDRRRLVIWCDFVKDPASLRYAWARNPLANVSNWNHMERMIPLPCFRTDTWEMPWGPECEALQGGLYKSKGRQLFNQLRKDSEAQTKKRKIEEAKLVLEKLK